VDYLVSCNHLVKIVKVYMLPFCGEIKMNIKPLHAHCTACVEQLSDNRGSVDCLYGVTWQATTSQNSQSVDSLNAVSDYFSADQKMCLFSHLTS